METHEIVTLILDTVHKCSIVLGQLQATHLRLVHLHGPREQRHLLAHRLIIEPLLLLFALRIRVGAKSVCNVLQDLERSRLVRATGDDFGTGQRAGIAN